ncbi:MAG: response regulator [Anaerolineales bacterium]|nr:response regulator [Anaerolineales bacterium]MCB8967392.1 response regulator [Ardenticatenaceae bacterium]
MNTSLKDAYIIVVEDDPNAQLITLDLLRLGGATRCYARKSVASALSYAENLPQVDLFLVDINMPGQSGYDLLETVRASEKFASAKVVAVTAGTLDADVNKARELGFDGFISKPLKMAEFVKQVERILKGEVVWDWR